MVSSNAIDIRGITKHYKGFSLEDISFSVPQGCVCGLVGENGAGKSTLIRLVMNAARADAGSIDVLGVSNTGADFQKIKEDIGVVLDEAYFPQTMSARMVGRMMRLAYSKWDDGVYGSLLDQFKLPPGKAFSSYSRGMRMRLGLAVALSHHPTLLILDEPTGGLDPMAREDLLEILNDFTRQEDHSILISSHIVSDLEKICDYMVCIHQGRLIVFEEKDALMDEYALLKLTDRQARSVPPEAVVARREGRYGVELLVKRQLAGGAFTPERATLEEIILFLVRAA